MFDGESGIEQRLRREVGVKGDGAIEEPGLAGDFNRFGLIKRRDCTYLAKSGEPGDGLAQMRGTVAQV